MKKFISAALLASFSILLPSAAAAQSAAAKLRESLLPIEGGTFLRGSAEAPYSANERVHETTVSSFRLAPTEATQALWREVMGANPSAFKNDSKPVETVSWLDAVRFCNALSDKEGLEKAYEISGANVSWNRSADGYRLPTEAEWEFAARGGRLGALGTEPLRRAPYAGGTEADAVAWFDRNSAKSSQAVARKSPNELGLYDMSGNVWEWCWDWYGNYPSTPVADPDGAPRGAGQRVMRGGAWFTPVNLLRVTYRYWNAPTFKANSVGFRLARNAAQDSFPGNSIDSAIEVDFFEALSAPEYELGRQ